MNATFGHNVRPLLYNQLNQTNKGNKMQSLLIKTVHIKTGLVHEFAYECHNEATQMAIINGTLESCSRTGWAISEMQVA